MPELERVIGRPDAAMAADDGRRVVALVAKHRGRVHLEHTRSLLRHGREHTLGTCLGRDERRDTPERTLLLREPPDLGELRLRVAFERALVGAARCGSPLRSMPAVTSSAGPPFSLGMSLFDHAISLRCPSFASQ